MKKRKSKTTPKIKKRKKQNTTYDAFTKNLKSYYGIRHPHDSVTGGFATRLVDAVKDNSRPRIDKDILLERAVIALEAIAIYNAKMVLQSEQILKNTQHLTKI